LKEKDEGRGEKWERMGDKVVGPTMVIAMGGATMTQIGM
jgi:hypothetical protein